MILLELEKFHNIYSDARISKKTIIKILTRSWSSDSMIISNESKLTLGFTFTLFSIRSRSGLKLAFLAFTTFLKDLVSTMRHLILLAAICLASEIESKISFFSISYHQNNIGFLNLKWDWIFIYLPGVIYQTPSLPNCSLKEITQFQLHFEVALSMMRNHHWWFEWKTRLLTKYCKIKNALSYPVPMETTLTSTLGIPSFSLISKV